MSMVLPLLHHGMVIMGLPYTEPQLQRTATGGTPYGATHVSGMQGNNKLSEDESELALAQGARLAIMAKKLA